MEDDKLSENEKIHLILEYICSKENQYGFESDEIAANINLTVPETNILIRKIIGNGDAKSCNSKHSNINSLECIFKLTATKDAFETKKYLTQENKDPFHKVNGDFVNKSRIEELRAINNLKFDLVRLIRLCKELNDNFRLGNYMTVVIICRAILDHVPPIFDKERFEEVVYSYGGLKVNKSFKKNMANLQNSLRNIADRFLNQVIRNKESLPNETQIDFRQDLDVLLEEISRILR